MVPSPNSGYAVRYAHPNARLRLALCISAKRYMKSWTKGKEHMFGWCLKMWKEHRNHILMLFVLFIITTMFILSFPYPLGEQRIHPDFPEMGSENLNNDSVKVHPYIPKEIWTGGTNPDEGGYYGWAQIYYETGRIYIPFEDIGPDKIQQIAFYKGNSPENSIFAKVDIEKGIWETKNRTVTITIYDGNNEGLAGVYIEITNRKGELRWTGFSDGDGMFTIENMPPDEYIVNITEHLPIKITFSTTFFIYDYPILSYVSVKNWSENKVTLSIHVDHYINPNLKNAYIYLDGQKEPIGKTGRLGNYSFCVSERSKIYHITVVKETEGIYPPPGSVVVNIDGKWAVANRWAPGYCYLIIPFWISHTVFFINVFMLAIACISTYFIAKRLYGHRAGVLSVLLVMVCSIGMVMIYARGMADYAAMTFATMGIALLLQSVQKSTKKSRIALNLLLGFLGGSCFAFAVTMRYSTIVVLIGPIIYLFIKLAKNVKKRTFSTATKNVFPIISTFILGLLIVGCLLASYNSTLFDSPFKSGYQMSHMIENVNGNTTIVSTEKTMFEHFFNPSPKVVPNIFNRILPQLFILLPTLFIAPLGLLLDFKNNRAWLLLFWIIPILIVYMQLSWVGQVPVEDMRYFLPVLPPTAILSAYAINQTTKNWEDEPLLYMLLASLIAGGFLIGYYGINWEIYRHEPRPPIIGVVLIILAYSLIYGRVMSDVFKKWKKAKKV